MNSERHRKLSEIFLQACELEAGERAAFLDQACGDDQEIRNDVENLLAQDEDGSWGSGDERLARSLRILPNEQTLPESVAAYRVIRRLGRGGMGEVFLVEQREPVHRLMALKLVRQGLDSREVIARFDSERQALAMMSHPNIAQVYEAGTTEDGRPYFAMEHVDGEPIVAYCDAHRLTVRERLELFIDVCHGLQHAHQKGVIHRDIKPSNILVQIQDGLPVPKIIDFGIAKATEQKLGEQSFFTRTGILIGTPEYMSPEQAQGRADVDTRSDVYSLGLVLYELLVGALPIDVRSLRKAGYLELCRVIQENETPRPSERLATLGEGAANAASKRSENLPALRRRVRGDLDWIVLKALEKNPERRYHSASELAADLSRHLDDLPVIAGPPSASYKLGKFMRRHRTGVGIASLLLLFGIAFALTVSVQLGIQARERAKAEVEARKAERVVEFLRQMLAAPHLEKLGPDARILDALDTASNGAADGLGDEPLVEAIVRETIGITYRSLGEFDKAERQLVRALEIRSETLAGNHPDLAKSHRELGALRFFQGRVREGAEELGRALEIYRADPKTGKVLLADVLNGLGAMKTSLGDLEESEALLREGISLLKAADQSGGGDLGLLATTYENLAGVMLRTARLDEAEALVRATLETKREAAGGRTNAGVATSTHNLAFILARRGAHAEAIPLFEESIAMETELAGKRNSTRVAAPIAALGRSYLHLGRYKEAEASIREALKIQREFLDPQAPAIGRTLSTLGTCLAAQGKYEEAVAVAHDATRILRHSDNASPRTIRGALTNEASFLESAGRLAEAEKTYREALAVHEGALPLGRLALLLIRDGRLKEAEELVARERAALIEAFGANAPALDATLAPATLLHARGEMIRAEQAYRAALAARRKTLGDDHRRVAEAFLGLAKCLRDIGRLDEAREAAQSALRIWKASEFADPRLVADARSILGDEEE